MLLKVEDAGIKLLGASLGIVPCRARFVGRFVAFSTFVSTTSGLFFGQAGALLGTGPLVPYLVGACVEINQTQWCDVRPGAPDNSSLSHFSAMTRPSWLCRAVRKRHHHAIE